MPDPLLAIEHLRVDFPEVIAVNDLTLALEPGDVCGLIGPNGAGKTTTMRAISGLQEFTRGSVRVGGHELASEPDELKKRLGFMPDFCPTYDQLTTSEFLEHFARAFDVPNRAQRIEQCLELTWLTDKRDSLCEELSRGMKQRLIILAHNDAEMLRAIDEKIEDRKRYALFEKLLPYFVIAVTIALCVFMYFYSGMK